MIRKVLAPIAALALLAASAGSAQLGNLNTPAAKPKAYVVYAADAHAVPAGKPATIELRFQLIPGFHVNSHTPSAAYLIPTALTVQPAAGVKAGPPIYPSGQLYSFSFDPKEKVDVYAGSFTVKLPVVAAPGEHTMDASLRYQACDNASCYPPRTVPLKIMLTAK